LSGTSALKVLQGLLCNFKLLFAKGYLKRAGGGGIKSLRRFAPGPTVPSNFYTREIKNLTRRS
jgi:hypothetical protein